MISRSLIFGVAFAVTAGAAEFRKGDVAGFSLSLIDNTRVEVYRFEKNGEVLAEIGKELGPVTLYVEVWRIDKGRLVIEDGNMMKEVFELIDRRAKSLKLRRQSGAVDVFEILPNPAAQQTPSSGTPATDAPGAPPLGAAY